MGCSSGLGAHICHLSLPKQQSILLLLYIFCLTALKKELFGMTAVKSKNKCICTKFSNQSSSPLFKCLIGEFFSCGKILTTYIDRVFVIKIYKIYSI